MNSRYHRRRRNTLVKCEYADCYSDCCIPLFNAFWGSCLLGTCSSARQGGMISNYHRGGKKMLSGSSLVLGKGQSKRLLLIELFPVDQERRGGERSRVNNQICLQIDWVFWRDHLFRVSEEIICVPCPRCNHKMTNEGDASVVLAKETLTWKLQEVTSYLQG